MKKMLTVVALAAGSIIFADAAQAFTEVDCKVKYVNAESQTHVTRLFGIIDFSQPSSVVIAQDFKLMDVTARLLVVRQKSGQLMIHYAYEDNPVLFYIRTTGYVQAGQSLKLSAESPEVPGIEAIDIECKI